ncbi:hypothetical protein [Pseudomonas oligotrophica]|uniref:hypothetical protein n=1 Tax=Pseudomonas oligotrophica TaxID=2912055 RepID=UPI001F386603|nr:hypothetical protein [Pseudomonas oligotrophica]MCF7203947.1 hypothetical protein [Pseudomonas oligotrophica]
MSKPLLATCALLGAAPFALAQTPEPEVITHLNGLDVRISPMGVPARTDAIDGELLGIRAIKVMNNSAQPVTCEFHVPAEARSDTSAPPVFNVAPNTQRTERVPGDYTPGEPFAEITCRGSEAGSAR